MIEQSEALLAVIGMRPIISHEIETITDVQWRRVLNIEDECDKGARELVHGKPKPVADAEGIDYMDTLRDLSTPYQPHQVEAMLSKLPTWFSDSSGAFLMLAARAFDFMGSELPRQVKADLTGPKNIQPPQRLVDRFLSLLEVLDDPFRVFDLAANAQLLGPQIKALDLVFPQLTDYMRKAVAMQIRDARAESAGFQMPYHADVGAQKFLGADLTSPALRKLLVTPGPPPAPSKDNAGAGKQASEPSGQTMTRVQRTDNLEVG